MVISHKLSVTVCVCVFMLQGFSSRWDHMSITRGTCAWHAAVFWEGGLSHVTIYPPPVSLPRQHTNEKYTHCDLYWTIYTSIILFFIQILEELSTFNFTQSPPSCKKAGLMAGLLQQGSRQLRCRIGCYIMFNNLHGDLHVSKASSTSAIQL